MFGGAGASRVSHQPSKISTRNTHVAYVSIIYGA